jgi:WD40 repeat protein
VTQSNPLAGFQVERELARGGMGVVYLARDPLGRQVVIKRILELSEAAVQRFRRESQVIARLDHPSVVKVHAAGVDEQGLPYMVLQLVEGTSLEARLRGGPLPWEEAAGICEQLADALAHSHGHGVLHRDLKPENVLLTAEGVAVLTDFGVAHDRDAVERLTQTGQLVGTACFMSPEQADGGSVDERTDVYGLGATLYALLSGLPPHQGNGMEVIAAILTRRAPPLPEGLPSDLRALCARAMAMDPADRYADAHSLRRDLRRVLAREPLAWARESRRWPLLVGLGALLLLGAGGAALAFRGEAEPAPPATPVKTSAGDREAERLARKLAREAKIGAEALAKRYRTRAEPPDPWQDSRLLGELEAWRRRHANHARSAEIARLCAELRVNTPIASLRLVPRSRSQPRYARVLCRSWAEGQILVHGRLKEEGSDRGRVALFSPPATAFSQRWELEAAYECSVVDSPHSLVGGVRGQLVRYGFAPGREEVSRQPLEAGSLRRAWVIARHPTLPLIACSFEAAGSFGVRFVALEPGVPTPPLIPFPAPVGAIAFAPGGETLAVCCGVSPKGAPDGQSVLSELRLYDWPTAAEPVAKVETGPQGVSLSFTPEGTLVVGCLTGQVSEFGERPLRSLRNYTVQSGQLRTAHSSVVEALALSGDGGRLYSCAKDELGVWARRSGQSLRRITYPSAVDARDEPPLKASSLVLSGEHLVVGTHEGVVLVYATNP